MGDTDVFMQVLLRHERIGDKQVWTAQWNEFVAQADLAWDAVYQLATVIAGDQAVKIDRIHERKEWLEPIVTALGFDWSVNKIPDKPHEAICQLKVRKVEGSPLSVACYYCVGYNFQHPRPATNVLHFVERDEHRHVCDSHVPPLCSVEGCGRMAINTEYDCKDHEDCLEHTRVVCYKHTTPSKVARS